MTFTNPPNPKDRANVEKAMTVTTTPHVDGAWSWITATQADWRPQSYWASGTKVSVQMNLNGVKAGDETFGSFTKGFGFTVGRDQRAIVDTKNFTMHVYQDGKDVKEIPTDTGMTGYSTWGGTMVVLDKEPMIEMKSCSVPGFSCTPGVGNYYDLKVYNDVHLTDSGHVHPPGGVGQPHRHGQHLARLRAPEARRRDLVLQLHQRRRPGDHQRRAGPGAQRQRLHRLERELADLARRFRRGGLQTAGQ